MTTTHFKGIKYPKTILMKVTSRERPDVLLETVKQYIELANNTEDMRWLFSFDSNDKTINNEEFIEMLFNLFRTDPNMRYPIDTFSYQGDDNYSIHLKYQNFEKKIYRQHIEVRFGTSNNKIDAINRDIEGIERFIDYHLILNISDDQRPVVQGYDDIIRAAMPDHLDASLWFNDGSTQDVINTQEILGRKYYERFNYIYYPGYKSFFCDNLSTLIAQHLGKCIKSDQCIIKHLHPQWEPNGPIKQDDLYRKNNLHWNHDQQLFNTHIQNGINKLCK